MDNNKRLYLDLHVIQTVPPSCVNRDDTGSPKTAVYGGVQRARVSSQSWKRAMREMFRRDFDESELGVRTKKIVDMVAEAIVKEDTTLSEQKAKEMANIVIEACGVKTKDGEAKALFFLGNTQAEALAKLVIKNNPPSKKEAQETLRKNQGVDIALFGRMVADDPTLNADASSQVAHSISTHRVDNEYDYFTAVDDLRPVDQPGAGMIGVVEYNSSTMYRYATIAVHDLDEELANEKRVVTKAVKTFVKAFITSMPTGKQNTFANRTMPDAVMITLRNDQPINFVGAFESPVRTENGGYVDESIKKLEEYADKEYATFASEPEKVWCIGMGKEQVNLSQLLEEVEKTINESL